uniref:Uncharacterized protein n=2 Tax=unclassified Streptomyces TaxID=2593676 RepID=V9Z4G2_9ACTN|nr:hypothetical protein pFRL3_161c [Streptomyces sp. FR1]AHE39422.1 hypothetical protein pFRL4_189c [Streptomyces sp. F2]
MAVLWFATLPVAEHRGVVGAAPRHDDGQAGQRDVRFPMQLRIALRRPGPAESELRQAPHAAQQYP